MPRGFVSVDVRRICLSCIVPLGADGIERRLLLAGERVVEVIECQAHYPNES